MDTNKKFPVRINKYLADRGYSSRRGADELIEKKIVMINDRVAVLGDMVQEHDTVTLKNNTSPDMLYAVYYKSKGETKETLTLNSTVLYAIDQLEKDLPGIVLFTNDRRISSRINDGKYNHEREYIVHMRDKLRDNFEEKILKGIHIEGIKESIKAKGAKILEDKICAIVLTVNAPHLVQRISLALFNEAHEIERVRVANITNEEMKPKQSRLLDQSETETLLESLGLKPVKY